MRTITLIIIHCSATPEGKSLSAEACRQDHIRHRGFRDIGYHFYITRDGEIHPGRPLEKVGAHCRNHNAHSIGICYEGGLNAEGQAKDTRTLEQRGASQHSIPCLDLIFDLSAFRGSFPCLFCLLSHNSYFSAKIFISDTPLHRGGSKTRPPSTDGETPPAKNT